MDTPEKFIAMQPYLQPLRPAFKAFCERHEFEFANPSSIGRYPRIRIGRVIDQVWVYFDLWMGYDENGKRYEEFFDQIPFEFSAGAFIDLHDEPEPPRRRRYGYSLLFWEGRPYCEIESTALLLEMERALPELLTWTPARLRAEGRMGPLR
jgi:hypothetical protein